MFLYNGNVWFIEFKKPQRGKASLLQKQRYKEFDEKGINFYLGVNHLGIAKGIIDWHSEGHTTPYLYYANPI